ncbi:succinate--CoA ligase subunit alpha [Schlegelella sp. S2-27]|uniref:Succinate--CoA ligase subunit alpha n=1 Tax=Caldimonas mangrovi TaxID=2944811 RepID=A0ABT0YTI4_9BURK|nr:CoA-binding protein [Caldimonas mangrovi]MCM5681943.1 succinate--CoA ligase subunit alpha [Caldimonas mangrovi]
MSILVDKHTRVITQGATGQAGQRYTATCRAYGNGRRCYVAGVNPNKAGQSLDGLPIFGSVAEARAATGATVSVVYVPPACAAAAIEEAVDADMALVICATDGLQADDMQRVRRRVQDSRTLLLGPQCPGVITPEQIAVGPLREHGFRPGRIGIVSRHFALQVQAAEQLAPYGLGQSTLVGIGQDPTGGLPEIDVLRLFNDDPATDAVLMLEDIGADPDGRCARWIAEHMDKPVFAFASRPEPDVLKRMRDNGIDVTCDPAAIGELVASRVQPQWLPFD